MILSLERVSQAINNGRDGQFQEFPCSSVSWKVLKSCYTNVIVCDVLYMTSFYMDMPYE